MKRIVARPLAVAHIYSPGRQNQFRWRYEIEVRDGNGLTLQEFRGRIKRGNRFELIASLSYEASWDGYKEFAWIRNQPTMASFGLKGVRTPTRPKIIINQVTSAH